MTSPHRHDADPRGVPHTATWWAKRWHVHRGTAAKRLAHIGAVYGSAFAWKVKLRGGGGYVASEASLSLLQIVKTGRTFVVVPRGAPDTATEDRETYVTEETHARAVGALDARIRRLEAVLGPRRVP